MPSGILTGFNLREYNVNVRRFFMFAVPLFSGMALQALLLNLYVIRLGFQEDFIGQLAGASQFASGLVAIPTGILSDRVGRKPFLIMTALMLAASNLGLLLTENAGYLLALSFAGGAAAGFLWVNHVPFLAENARPERRGQAIAIWMSIQTITRLVVNLIGGAMPDLFGRLTDTSTDLPEPFRYTLYIGAALSLVAVLPLINISAPAPKRAPSPDGAANPSRAPWRLLAVFGSVSSMRGMAMGLSFPFFNVFFANDLATTTATIGIVFALSQVCGLPSTISAPAIARRFGTCRTIVPLGFLSAASLVAFGQSDALVLASAVFLLMTSAESIATPTEMTFGTYKLDRAYWARMQSLRVTGFQLASGAASVVAGMLILRYGYWATFACAGAARAVSAIIFAGAFGLGREEPNA